MVKDDHPDRSEHPSSTSAIESPTTELATRDTPTVRLPGEPKSAAKGLFEAMGMSVQSGPSVAIKAFSALPEPIQKQHLENDAQRDRFSFDLEQKQIEARLKEAEAEREHKRKEREAQLAHERLKWERSQGQHETSDRRAFWFVVGAGVAAVGGTVALFAFNRDTIAAHLVNTLIAGGLGYQGGKSSGMFKVGSQSLALPADKHGDDK